MIVALGLFVGLMAITNEVVFARAGHLKSCSEVVGGILIPGDWFAWSAALILPFGSDVVRTLAAQSSEE